MVKCWCPAIRLLVLKNLRLVWQDRHIPTWMRDKLVRLVPKTPGTTDLANMRPISLYETTRKLWKTILARRIHQIWHDNDLLNPHQYGYRLHSGTQMPLFNVLNLIENAHKSGVSTLITFWDFKRAFDSISRNLQRLAWRRLGLTPDFTNWMVHLDEDGFSSILTPHYARTKALRNSAQMLKSNQSFSPATESLSFQAERGIGQGESASSLMWVAVYDILLDWLDLNNRTLHPRLSTTPIQLSLNAYADDIASATMGQSALKDQQELGSCLSVFGCFSGLELKVEKTIPFWINPPPACLSASLYIFDQTWHARACPIHTSICRVKYLGVELDHYLVNQSGMAFQDLLQHAQTLLDHLLDQAASPHVKIDYIRFKILPTLIARAICGNWTLSTYRQLDIPLNRAFKLLLAIPRSYPVALLYAPTSHGGVGLPRLSDSAQLMKWAALKRSDALGGPARSAMQTLLTRVPGNVAHVNTEVLYSLNSTLLTSHNLLIARSVVEWAHESGLTITRRTRHTFNTPSRFNIDHTLSTIAAEIRQHFDPTSSGYIPVSCIATDGSFTPSPQSFSSMLHYKAPSSGTGAGAIVFMSNDITYNHVAIRILSEETLHGMTPFSWELLCHTLAYQLLRHLPTPAPLYSDCEGAIEHTNRALLSKNPRVTGNALDVLIANTHSIASTVTRTPFTWVRSHPERDSARTRQPTMQDISIFIADRTAAGASSPLKLGAHLIPVHTITLTLPSVVPYITPTEYWHVRSTQNPAVPILDRLRHYQLTHQHSVMLSRRDLSTSYKILAANYWNTTSFSLAALLNPLPPKSTYWQAARHSIILYDYLGHARNLHKISNPDDLRIPPCHHCGLPETQQHLFLECQYPPLLAIRQTAKENQHRIAQSIKPGLPPFLSTVVDNFVFGSWCPTSRNLRRLWIGLWSQDTLISLFPPNFDLSTTVSPARITQFTNTMQSLTEPLIEAYRLLLAKVIGSVTPPILPQPTNPRLLHQLTSTHIQHPEQLQPGLHHIVAVDSDYYQLSNFTYNVPVSNSDTET